MRKTRAIERPRCAQPECDAKLYTDNLTGYCKAHRTPTAKLGLRCFQDGCDARLRAHNSIGACKNHAHQHPERVAAEKARYREDEAYRLDKIRRATKSVNERRAAGIEILKPSNPEAQQRSRMKRRAVERDLFVEHINLVELLEEHGSICHICSTLVDPSDWHADHVIPLSFGGPHCRANMAPSHPRCNLVKSNVRSGSPDLKIDATARAAYLDFHGVEWAQMAMRGGKRTGSA